MRKPPRPQPLPKPDVGEHARQVEEQFGQAEPQAARGNHSHGAKIAAIARGPAYRQQNPAQHDATHKRAGGQSSQVAGEIV